MVKISERSHQTIDDAKSIREILKNLGDGIFSGCALTHIHPPPFNFIQFSEASSVNKIKNAN